MDVNLRALRYFVMSAETGTISEAARRLNISQPSVSAAIQQLEDLYNVQLFLRVPTKGIELTVEGLGFLERARLLLSQSDQFRHDVDAISHTLGGEITVASFVNLTPTITAELVGAFHEKHPNIQVRILDMDQHDILSGLAAGKVELAITFDLALQSGFSASVMATLPPYAVLPPEDSLAQETAVSLHDVATRPFVLMDLPHTRDYFHRLFADQRIVPRIDFRCHSVEAVRSFVASGLGVSVLNIRPSNQMTYSGRPVVMRPIAEPLRPLKIVLLRNNRLRMRPALSLFADLATRLIPALVAPHRK
ncbi:LysR family transcriptional regulator [Citreicella sp. C3M06]|uniref:LysR family transcriptional regulator n=1 Tax=Citreicella sp. C3M06 TaxID=2841564 RepID=UPI001C08F371|nr:LysR family transcriptional regulator [Citreicella sp. C3M06]MBU2961108.1 LysR family transcriptional regulator [Citreicella sp. C3M06]